VSASACATTERFNIGRLGNVVHPGGSTHYCHDRFGQLTRKVQILNGKAVTVRYAYDAAGRLKSVTYPDGSVADYIRDTQGRITEVGLKRSGQARELVASNITHAPFGPITSWTSGNGRRLDRPVDQDYRPQSVQDMGSGGLSLAFGYDAVGALIELRSADSNAVLSRYEYDGMGRLLEATNATGMPTHTYGWDATGNRLQAGGAAGTDAYHYASDSHRLTSVGDQTRTYTAVGSTSRRHGKDLVYNAAGRLGQVKQGATVLGNYRYNHRGERVLRQSGSTTISVLYDEAGQWLGEYTAGGAARQQVVWLENYPIAVFGPASTGASLAYIQPDHLGTPRNIIDAVRNVSIWRWDLQGEAFGADAANEDPDGDGVAYKFPLRFPGQQYTLQTGLYYNYQRDYDPIVGRYVQSDPIGLRGGIGTYGYALGRSLTVIDPLGLAPGQRYRSIHAAGAAAVTDANELTRRTGFEYGGRIYKLKGGGFTYSDPITDGEKFSLKIQRINPDTVGDYHTHGGYDKYVDGRSVNPELFSEIDYITADMEAEYATRHGNKYFSYLGTPSGVIKVYDPDTGNIRNVSYPKKSDVCP